MEWVVSKRMQSESDAKLRSFERGADAEAALVERAGGRVWVRFDGAAGRCRLLCLFVYSFSCGPSRIICRNSLKSMKPDLSMSTDSIMRSIVWRSMGSPRAETEERQR